MTNTMLTIAKMELSGYGVIDRPDLEPLKAAYPELDFVFSRLEQLIRKADEHEYSWQMQVDDMERDIEELESRVQDLRSGVAQLASLVRLTKNDFVHADEYVAEADTIAEELL